MNLTLRVTRNSLGTLTEELLTGSGSARSPYDYPKTLNRELTKCVSSSSEYGVFTSVDQPVKFYFAAPQNTAPVLVCFGDLEFPARLEPDCTQQRAEVWAREYLRVLVRRLDRVEKSRIDLETFSVSVSTGI